MKILLKKYIILLMSFVALTSLAQVPGFIEPAQSLLSEQKQITFVGTRSGEGYFSNDGKKMIYQSERDEANPFYQMFVLDLQTGKSTRLSTGEGMTTCGWIHPNLKKSDVVFNSSR